MSSLPSPDPVSETHSPRQLPALHSPRPPRHAGSQTSECAVLIRNITKTYSSLFVGFTLTGRIGPDPGASVLQEPETKVELFPLLTPHCSLWVLIFLPTSPFLFCFFCTLSGASAGPLLSPVFRAIPQKYRNNLRFLTLRDRVFPRAMAGHLQKTAPNPRRRP